MCNSDEQLQPDTNAQVEAPKKEELHQELDPGSSEGQI